MEPSEVRNLVFQLGSTSMKEREAAWQALKPLDEAVIVYFLEAYPTAKQRMARISYVFHSMKYARTCQPAFNLGILALNDKATLVRYRACELLAYSLRKDAIPYLANLLDHSDKPTAEDAHAAIDAINHQNHHFFLDRQHTGKKFLVINEDDKP